MTAKEPNEVKGREESGDPHITVPTYLKVPTPPPPGDAPLLTMALSAVECRMTNPFLDRQ